MQLIDFRFAQAFPSIASVDMQLYLDEAEVMWAGIRTLWSKLPADLKLQKQDLCMQFLSAWYIADLVPKSVVGGVFNSGGTPLESKSIDGISVKYKARSLPPNLEQLASNAFGVKALDMILSCPDRLLIHG